jgi:hypothetical protein
MPKGLLDVPFKLCRYIIVMQSVHHESPIAIDTHSRAASQAATKEVLADAAVLWDFQVVFDDPAGTPRLS